MLKQIDFKHNGTDYIMLFDGDKMTEEQALKEVEFTGWGKGCDESLYPYYITVPKSKQPILWAIRTHLRG